jgi:hypothetical protein
LTVVGRVDDASLRPCVGLRHLLDAVRSHGSGNVLDLGDISQASVDWFAAAGHRLFTESLLRSIERACREAEPHVDSFLAENLRYPAEQFDAVLCWDLLEFLPPSFLEGVVGRLHEIAGPGARLLAFFHSPPVGPSVRPSRYEIAGEDLLRRAPTSSPLTLARALSKRDLDRLFHGRFGMNDILAPDGLHEVLLVKPHGESA